MIKNTKEEEKQYATLQRKARKALKQCEGLRPNEWPAIVHEYLDHPITVADIKANDEYRAAINH